MLSCFWTIHPPHYFCPGEPIYYSIRAMQKSSTIDTMYLQKRRLGRAYKYPRYPIAKDRRKLKWLYASCPIQRSRLLWSRRLNRGSRCEKYRRRSGDTTPFAQDEQRKLSLLLTTLIENAAYQLFSACKRKIAANFCWYGPFILTWSHFPRTTSQGRRHITPCYQRYLDPPDPNMTTSTQ
jgi:hypothetical protein